MVSFLASKYIQFTSDVIMTSSWYFTWAFRLIGFGRVSRDRLVECWVWLRLFWLVDSGSIQNGWFVIGWVWLAEVRFFEVRIGLNYVIVIFCVSKCYIFVRFQTTNLKKEIVSQKNRTWSGTRSNEFHEFSSKWTGQRKSGITATAIYSKRSIWPSSMKLGFISSNNPFWTNRGFDGELVAFSVSLNTECWLDADVKFFSCDLFFWLILVVLYKGTSTFVCTWFFVLRPKYEFLISCHAIVSRGLNSVTFYHFMY